MRSFVYRLSDGGPEVVQRVFEERGWVEYDEDAHDGSAESEGLWNVWWRVSRFRMPEMRSVHPWQRLNHFPKTHEITRKDRLTRNLRKMRAVHGAVYDFVPTTFILPNDYTRFVAAYSEESGSGAEAVWICKPADLSRGRGIFLFRDINHLTYDSAAVVQKYVANPLLIGGYKFDLRIYVAVTSFYPLCIYLYDEGLTRFSTDKYSLETIGNVFSHLTNTSINKNAPGIASNKDAVGAGCKWSLEQLRAYFAARSVNDGPLWKRIEKIVVLTILALAPVVPQTSNCFELFGFDVLVDDALRPWLLEVNFSPALGADCDVDWQVKRPLINDIIDLLCLGEEDKVRVPGASESDDDGPGFRGGAGGGAHLGQGGRAPAVYSSSSGSSPMSHSATPSPPVARARKTKPAARRGKDGGRTPKIRTGVTSLAATDSREGSDGEVEEDIGARSGGDCDDHSNGAASPESTSGSDVVIGDAGVICTDDEDQVDGAHEGRVRRSGDAMSKAQDGRRTDKKKLRLPAITSPPSSSSSPPDSPEEDVHARTLRGDALPNKSTAGARDARPLLQKRGSVPSSMGRSTSHFRLGGVNDRQSQSHSDLFRRNAGAGGLGQHTHSLVALPSLHPSSRQQFQSQRGRVAGGLASGAPSHAHSRMPLQHQHGWVAMQFSPERERVGKFKRIFPYDDATARMCVPGKAVDVRAVVSEIKASGGRKGRTVASDQ